MTTEQPTHTGVPSTTDSTQLLDPAIQENAIILSVQGLITQVSRKGGTFHFQAPDAIHAFAENLGLSGPEARTAVEEGIKILLFTGDVDSVRVWQRKEGIHEEQLNQWAREGIIDGLRQGGDFHCSEEERKQYLHRACHIQKNFPQPVTPEILTLAKKAMVTAFRFRDSHDATDIRETFGVPLSSDVRRDARGNILWDLKELKRLPKVDPFYKIGSKRHAEELISHCSTMLPFTVADGSKQPDRFTSLLGRSAVELARGLLSRYYLAKSGIRCAQLFHLPQETAQKLGVDAAINLINKSLTFEYLGCQEHQSDRSVTEQRGTIEAVADILQDFSIAMEGKIKSAAIEKIRQAITHRKSYERVDIKYAIDTIKLWNVPIDADIKETGRQAMIQALRTGYADHEAVTEAEKLFDFDPLSKEATDAKIEGAVQYIQTSTGEHASKLLANLGIGRDIPEIETAVRERIHKLLESRQFDKARAFRKFFTGRKPTKL